MKDQGAFGVITNDHNEILLVQLPEDFKEFPKAWNLPGGLVNANEDPADAAFREVQEETGITCEITAALEKIDAPTLTLYFYRGYYISGKIKLQVEEVINAGWFSKDDALNLNLAFDVRQRISTNL